MTLEQLGGAAVLLVALALFAIGWWIVGLSDQHKAGEGWRIGE